MSTSFSIYSTGAYLVLFSYTFISYFGYSIGFYSTFSSYFLSSLFAGKLNIGFYSYLFY